jgi:hypothetical protein
MVVPEDPAGLVAGALVAEEDSVVVEPAEDEPG